MLSKRKLAFLSAAIIFGVGAGVTQTLAQSSPAVTACSQLILVQKELTQERTQAIQLTNQYASGEAQLIHLIAQGNPSNQPQIQTLQQQIATIHSNQQQVVQTIDQLQIDYVELVGTCNQAVPVSP